jgi:SagB-type dehydrogenase family enzyme
MKKRQSMFFLLVVLAIFLFALPSSYGQNEISLPAPILKSQKSFEEILSTRRSRRSFKEGAISLKELSCILWASQGITSKDGKRTVPSAGALYPLEIYVVAGENESLEPGIYHYDTPNHKLVKVVDKDKRKELNSATRAGRTYIENAPLSIVITAIYDRTTKKYDQRGIRYVHIEAGAVCQNIYLQAESLNLSTFAIGAFDDSEVKKVLQTDADPILIMPIGKRI